MTLTATQIRALKDWSATATHLEGEFFRSVSMNRTEPAEVLGGYGAASYGGRFASKGTRAVYLSTTDAGTGKETTERKKRLGGAALINTDKYPRVIFVIDVKLAHVVRLEELKASLAGEALMKQCLDEDDLEASKALAEFLVKEGVQGLIFPSVVRGGDDNLVLYPDNYNIDDVRLRNEKEFLAQAEKIAAKRRTSAKTPSSP